MTTLPKWYLAGPFFNPAQLTLQMKIEILFADNEVPAFSPRLCDENNKKVLTAADAGVIFSRNVNNILDCGCMLAVLDWKMPDGDSMRLCKRATMSSHRPSNEYEPDAPLMETQVSSSGPLNLPDTGTVFEMGAMYMQWLLLHQMANSRFPSSGGKPRLVGFTERGENDKLNIMLTQACCGIIHGLNQLNTFLNKGDLRWEIVKPWAGANL